MRQVHAVPNLLLHANTRGALSLDMATWNANASASASTSNDASVPRQLHLRDYLLQQLRAYRRQRVPLQALAVGFDDGDFVRVSGPRVSDGVDTSDGYTAVSRQFHSGGITTHEELINVTTGVVTAVTRGNSSFDDATNSFWYTAATGPVGGPATYGHAHAEAAADGKPQLSLATSVPFAATRSPSSGAGVVSAIVDVSWLTTKLYSNVTSANADDAVLVLVENRRPHLLLASSVTATVALSSNKALVRFTPEVTCVCVAAAAPPTQLTPHRLLSRSHLCTRKATML